MEQILRNNIMIKSSKISLAVIISESDTVRFVCLTVKLKGDWAANVFFVVSERQEKRNIRYRNESKQEERKYVRASLNDKSESKPIPTHGESTASVLSE